MSQMSKGDFLLQNLAKLGKFLIISDENNPEDFMKDITNYKKLCTGDPIYLNIKNDAPVGRVFRGRIVQCINGIIKMAEINGATERRFYPMLYKTHVDTGDGRGGITRNKLIKSKWMKDQRVIDWFLTEAINRNICPLPKTQEMLKLRDEIEEHNSSVLRFIKKYLPNMMQNWVEVENLYQAYRAVVLSEGGKPCNLDNFKTDAVRALKKTDSGWTYNHNEDDPSVFVNKNMGQFHIPMGAWSLNYLGMNDDVVYTNLKNLASDDHKRDPGHAAAKNALRTIYSMNKPGTKGKNTFYRTPDAEAAVLIRIARQLINEAARDAEDNLPIEVVLEILNAKQRYEWPDGNNPFNCSPKKAGARLVDVDFTVRPSQGVYPDKEKVWDHVIKRLKKLAKEVDVLQIDA